ncbi:thermostable hemolysin [Pseudoalteromonas rubra]|uniref:Thermostable hemolysin n=1 Tax=Pseudoalteromonas rubra TaxID=43658 RepID=A0A5S3UVP8_9GAMM|nr:MULTISPECIES: thermostable hemolysin [Pseudoalteromonas]MEC4088227.1 thermostable hemolysin [Pseudoalteromonas rubra]QPB85710.1 thermostable hemolysin [Pseudoalteromonas rubra]
MTALVQNLGTEFAPLQLSWAEQNSSLRAALESDIHAGFRKAFDAQIKHFYPLLSEFRLTCGHCCLGLRLAGKHELFVEQYLRQDIEQAIQAHSVGQEFKGQHMRFEIAELGNLVSTNRKASLLHFIIVTQALTAYGVRYLTFAATSQVRALLSLLKVPVHVLADAADDIAVAADYGSYYQQQPKVCVVALSDAKLLIRETALFRRYANQYRSETEYLLEGLRHA